MNQKKRTDTIFNNLVDSNSISKETRKSGKPVVSSLRTMYGIFIVHRPEVDDSHPFRIILSVLQTSTYNFATFLVLISNLLTEQGTVCSMGSLDVDSFFTNIPFDKTIQICINQLFGNSDMVQRFKQSQRNQLLWLVTMESYFILNTLLLYKETDGVAMGSHLGPSFANSFLSYHEKSWFKDCPQGLISVFH